MAEHITDHDAPVWNAAIEAARDVVDGVLASGRESGAPHLSSYQRACLNIDRALRGLIRPELSAEEMAASGERLATAFRTAHQAQMALPDVLAALREISDHPFTNYDAATGEKYEGAYGVGVVDGHRACARIARAALSPNGATP